VPATLFCKKNITSSCGINLHSVTFWTETYRKISKVRRQHVISWFLPLSSWFRPLSSWFRLFPHGSLMFSPSVSALWYFLTPTDSNASQSQICILLLQEYFAFVGMRLCSDIPALGCALRAQMLVGVSNAVAKSSLLSILLSLLLLLWLFVPFLFLRVASAAVFSIVFYIFKCRSGRIA